MLDEWNGIYINSKDEKIKLSWNELYILEYMIEHKNRTMRARELVEAAYGKGSYHSKRSNMGIYIERLRQKLAGEIEIINKPWIGYKIKYIGG